MKGKWNLDWRRKQWFNQVRWLLELASSHIAVRFFCMVLLWSISWQHVSTSNEFHSCRDQVQFSFTFQCNTNQSLSNGPHTPIQLSESRIQPVLIERSKVLKIRWFSGDITQCELSLRKLSITIKVNWTSCCSISPICLKYSFRIDLCLVVHLQKKHHLPLC